MDNYISIINKYNRQKELLSEILDRASSIMRDVEMNDTSNYLDGLRQKIKNDTFKVLVTGRIASGKSTLINSLLGEVVLPAYTMPRAAVISGVRYGEKKEAILHFRNPLPENLPTSIASKALAHMQKHNMKDVPPLHVDYNELEDYVVIPIREDNTTDILLESPYEKVEILWPLDMLNKGLEIIEIPWPEIPKRVTMDYLAGADAIVFVLTADFPCSKNELEFVENNLKACGFTDILFVVNKIDLITEQEKERLMEFTETKLAEFTTNPIHYASALQALASKVKNNPVLYEKSQMGLFIEKLLEFLATSKGKLKLSQPVLEIKRILNNEALHKVISAQRAMLGSSLNEVQARYDAAKPELDTLRTQKEQIIKKMMLRIEQSQNEFMREINRNILSVAEMIPGWIKDYVPVQPLGIIPTNKKISAIVNEITDEINKKISEQQRQWNNEIMRPLVREKTEYIFEGPWSNYTLLCDTLKSIYIYLFSGKSTETNDFDSHPRTILRSSRTTIEDIHSANYDELVNEALGIGSTHWIYYGFVNPITLGKFTEIALALYRAGVYGKRLIKGLKEHIATKYVERLTINMDSISQRVSRCIAENCVKIVHDLSQYIDDEINQMVLQIDDSKEEMRNGQISIQNRMRVLDSCEVRIRTLSTELEQFISELL